MRKLSNHRLFQGPPWWVFFLRHYRVLIGLWLALVLIACVMPVSSEQPPTLPHIDKIVHALFYAPPMALALLAGGNVWRWVILLIVFALGIELIQSMLSYRSGDIFDMLANIVGMLLGFIVAKFFRMRP
ncbi:VanZ family protein [Suttonella sp. R2A3]|uniref:VanZ family protein n=1 Tax=Suttonella sp. R2A3 TaxID=2908648 RepID=UPI001F187E89|nr:VanZ family protein [Suttonella sp. R2A3]UJF24181.1 VanZ family protein [Suttonella sp. R2A3]